MISVVIPCYNCASFVRRSVDSVLKQQFQDYELILVDNRSTDGTLHILNQYREQYPGKVHVYHEDRKGAPAARNCGLNAARGEWIQFLDADDEILPAKLAIQEALGRESGAGVVVGAYLVEEVRGSRRLETKRYPARDAWKGLIASDLGITSSNLWRRTDLLAVNGWKEDQASSQEYELLFRLLKQQTSFAFDNSLLTRVHRRESSVSKSKNKKRLIEIVQTRIDLRSEIRQYLHAAGQLNRELNTLIDKYIYLEMKRNSRALPEYTDAFLRNHPLEVPLNLMLKTNARLKLKSWLPFLSQ